MTLFHDPLARRGDIAMADEPALVGGGRSGGHSLFCNRAPAGRLFNGTGQHSTRGGVWGGPLVVAAITPDIVAVALEPNRYVGSPSHLLHLACMQVIVRTVPRQLAAKLPKPSTALSASAWRLRV